KRSKFWPTSQISALGSFCSLHCSLPKLFRGKLEAFFQGELSLCCFVSKRFQGLFAVGLFDFWRRFPAVLYWPRTPGRQFVNSAVPLQVLNFVFNRFGHVTTH